MMKKKDQIQPQQLLKEYVGKKKERYRSAALKVLEHFECSRCGKCCQYLVYIDKREAKRISRSIHKPINRFVVKVDGFLYLKQPCPFLEEANVCTIHSFKPIACRMYPFHREEPFLLEVNTCILSRKIFEFMNMNISELEIIANEMVDLKLEEEAWRAFKLLSENDSEGDWEEMSKAPKLNISREFYNHARIVAEGSDIFRQNRATDKLYSKTGEKTKHVSFPIELVEAVAKLFRKKK